MYRQPRSRRHSIPEPKAGAADSLPDLLRLCRSMTERSSLPLAVVDGATCLRYANPAFCDLIGRTSEDLLGIAFAQTVPDGGACLAPLNRVYRTGKAETYTKPDLIGSERDSWSYVMWPILGGNEGPLGVIIQVNGAMLIQQQGAAMNESLVLAGIRQHELTEVAETQNAQLQLEIEERKRAEEALQKALNEVRTLRGILPICSNCKRIRDDQGYWSQVEVYVRDHTEADFTHGICPDCIESLYPELGLIDGKRPQDREGA